jgi:hypothetical protein
MAETSGYVQTDGTVKNVLQLQELRERGEQLQTEIEVAFLECVLGLVTKAKKWVEWIPEPS